MKNKIQNIENCVISLKKNIEFTAPQKEQLNVGPRLTLSSRTIGDSVFCNEEINEMCLSIGPPKYH